MTDVAVPAPGCYGVVQTGGFVAWSIRHLTRSKWNHAFICLGGGVILEAQPSGSRLAVLANYAGLTMLFSKPAPDYQPAADLLAAQRPWLGIPYGFPDIVWLGLDYGLDWRPKWLLDQVLDEHDMICSQLVAAWGRAHGADWSCGQEYDQEVTPGLLGADIGG